MLKLLACIPPTALALAAADAALTRLALAHRPTSAALFIETAGVYAVLCLLALPLIALLYRGIGDDADEGRSRGLGRACLGVALVGGAVAAHAAIDRHTGLDANLAGLKSARPWLEALGALVGVWLVAKLLAVLLRRLESRTAWAAVCFVSIAVGLLVPPRFGSLRSAPPAEAAEAAPALTAATPEQPNLLLLIWDTARRQSFSLFGYDGATTPELAAFAAEAERYSRAHSVTHYTFTSHLSMLTGRLPTEHGARLLDSRAEPERTGRLIQERLAAAGYRTGAFVGTGVLRASTGIARGFEAYGDRVDPAVCDSFAWALVHDLQSAAAKFVPALARHGNPHWIEDFQRPGHEVLAEARTWIENGDPRPWFCMVNLFDVHHPYTPDPEAAERWVAPYDGPLDGHVFRSDDYPAGYRPDDRDDGHLVDLYDAEMWRLDQRVAEFLGALDLDATAVLMTADHGEAFGEHDVYGHDDILEPQVSVPLVLRPPGGAAEPRDIDAPVSGIDVAATLLAFAGLAPEADSAARDLGAAEPEQERIVWVEDRDFHEPRKFKLAAYVGPFKIVQSLDGDFEDWTLHDLTTDPNAERDVSAEHPEVFAELVELVRAQRPWWPNNADGSRPQARGGDSLGALRALGYMEGEPTFGEDEEDEAEDAEHAPRTSDE